MKKVALFILLGFFANSAFGQETDFPNEFAVWRYDYNEEGGQPFYSIYYYMEGDSTYMNTSYKKIFGEGLIRSEDKRVYFIPQNDTIEYLIYDFNLEVGDKFFPPQYAISSGIDTLIVTQINSTSLYGGVRKVWHFDAATTWIEGIGTESGFFSNPFYIGSPNGSSSLQCFVKDSIIIDSQCQPNDSSDETIEQIHASVFPNPFYDEITIKTELSKFIDLIQVFDVNGRLINSIEGISTIQMNSELSNGLYFLRVVIGEQEFYRRVIK
ncbi:MAG: hypothetical protein ACI9XO_004980 [Paraglaciecola sp.]|jgi:hypothetical protein